MALEDQRSFMEVCRRCSCCKFIPFEKMTGFERANVCPSISKHEFHTYCAGGRLVDGTALLQGKLDITDKFLDVVYKCNMCGGCDVSCKYSMDMEVIEPLNEIRNHCVENGRTLPVLDKLIERMRATGSMLPGAPAKRGEWAEGLDIKDCTKEKVDVVFHVGCQTSFNKEMWGLARTTAKLLRKAGVDFGIAKENETCCGGRAFEMGYKDAFLEQAKKNMEMVKSCGATTLVTDCSNCYQAFKVLYDQYGFKGELKVLHITEYLAQLISEGKLKPTKPVNMVVTYHDPCHLGRMGESFIPWDGVEVLGDLRTFDPPKEYRRGTYGIYEPPRDIIRSIPGMKLVEMYRIKEYAWCCGAGGGVTETNPEFSAWTAKERIDEAADTGASAIVTACPWCIKNFKDAIAACGSELKVYDVIEVLDMAL